MRITRDRLLKYAESAAALQVHADRRMVCIYLTGSLLREEPLLGGSTDIDLVYVHDSEPAVPREVRRITDEVSLDIAHVSQAMFRHPRQLRSDPWWGSYLCYNPIVLYETQHWFEFTQASVGAQFDLAENVMRRARPLAEAARQSWSEMIQPALAAPAGVLSYLRCLRNAGNAIACLSGPPLTMRRFFIEFPQRAESIDRPGLSGGLIDLFTTEAGGDLEKDTLINHWSAALAAAGELPSCPPHLMPYRSSYYLRAVEALWEVHRPASLWMLINTWTEALSSLPDPSALSQPWHELCGLVALDPSHFSSRQDALDTYLDGIEETLDLWAAANGVVEEKLS